jgi:hypothetical protein
LSQPLRTHWQKVLGDGTTLSPHALVKASLWPDQVRAREQYGTVQPEWTASDVAEAHAFNAAPSKNDLWHFVNLPIGAPGIQPSILSDLMTL